MTDAKPVSEASSPGRIVLIKAAGAALLALMIGSAIGFVAGRSILERQWSTPPRTLTQADETRSSANGADPSPKANTRVLGAMPIGRARLALAAMTVGDPAIATVASIGAGNDGFELHVVIENRGRCKISSVSGVAYGFNARGRPTAANKNGEQYVAFTADLAIEPGKKAMASQTLHHGAEATLSIAHIDATTCSDGPPWKRPR